ncbi:hypothetical protein BTE48_02385 [Oceanospirillum multiglobuliferum]|uniref:SprT-like domain-containing protein n=2 Tax=Oceanospirillum multiglobuliferum TaxID=64969 RepID=A0A1V4T8B7_9GAMM|nr:hypothetical protein BTE48_02385 [Oceanospirillum multiglobuliferum]
MMFWLAKAEQHLLKNFPMPELDLSLRGRCAGQAYLQVWRVRFNLQLLSENYEHFMLNVVPHELAHLIAFREFGRRIRPHGKEWTWVMEQVLGVPAKTTHQYDVSKSANQQYTYRCGCVEREHHLTIRRHNKVAQGVSYLCKYCRQSLVFAYKKSL